MQGREARDLESCDNAPARPFKLLMERTAWRDVVFSFVLQFVAVAREVPAASMITHQSLKLSSIWRPSVGKR